MENLNNKNLQEKQEIKPTEIVQNVQKNNSNANDLKKQEGKNTNNLNKVDFNNKKKCGEQQKQH